MRHNSRGFTLIELLVVISIIGLLASVILAALTGVRAKARDASRLEQLHQVEVALDSYSASTGSYPEQSLAGSGIGFWDASTGWSTLSTLLVPAYTSALPPRDLQYNTTTGVGPFIFYAAVSPTFATSNSWLIPAGSTCIGHVILGLITETAGTYRQDCNLNTIANGNGPGYESIILY